MILSKKIISCISILAVVGSFIGCGSSNSAATKNATNSIESKDVFGYNSWSDTRVPVQAGYFKYPLPATIQLLGVGNENEKPFRVIGFETNSSGVTVFYPEGGGKARTVHCDYKVIYDK